MQSSWSDSVCESPAVGGFSVICSCSENSDVSSSTVAAQDQCVLLLSQLLVSQRKTFALCCNIHTSKFLLSCLQWNVLFVRLLF